MGLFDLFSEKKPEREHLKLFEMAQHACWQLYIMYGLCYRCEGPVAFPLHVGVAKTWVDESELDLKYDIERSTASRSEVKIINRRVSNIASSTSKWLFSLAETSPAIFDNPTSFCSLMVMQGYGIARVINKEIANIENFKADHETNTYLFGLQQNLMSAIPVATRFAAASQLRDPVSNELYLDVLDPGIKETREYIYTWGIARRP